MVKIEERHRGQREDATFRMRRQIQRTMSRSFPAAGSQFDPRDFEVVELEVSSPTLPSVFDGYRIAQLSDIHYGQWIRADRLKGVVELVNRQKPDLVAITGDFVSYSPDGIGEMAPILGGLRPSDAVVAVLGNHDHWLGARRVRELLKEANIIDVSNGLFTVRRSGSSLHIAGVDSVMLGKDRLDHVVQKLPPGEPAILLAHEPDFADVSSKTGRFLLQLSGHSHGGQLVIPGLGVPFRGTLSHRYPLGRYKAGEMVHYTNRGIGTNGFWVRINSPPEITVLKMASGRG